MALDDFRWTFSRDWKRKLNFRDIEMFPKVSMDANDQLSYFQDTYIVETCPKSLSMIEELMSHKGTNSIFRGSLNTSSSLGSTTLGDVVEQYAPLEDLGASIKLDRLIDIPLAYKISLKIPVKESALHIMETEDVPENMRKLFWKVKYYSEQYMQNNKK